MTVHVLRILVFSLLYMGLFYACGGAGGGVKGSNLGHPTQIIAVLELKNTALLDKGEIHYLNNLLRQAVGRLPSEQYSALTNDNIAVMLPPEVNLDECGASCAVDVGRTVQAHWVLVGEVVKFGEELRVDLKLHNTKTAQLVGSAVVKGVNTAELEGPLQGTAVGLFSTLDPSLKRVAERLKRGFVFAKFQYSALPDFSKDKGEGKAEQSINMPSNTADSIVKGVDLGSVDADGLALYDSALKLDRDRSAKPETKVAKWQEVSENVKEMKSQALARVKEWQSYMIERDQLAEFAKQRAKQDRLRREVGLKQLQALPAEDAEVDSKRQTQMAKDWTKLSKIIGLEEVNIEDKLNWVEAFVEAYGAVPKLNPHLSDLKGWTNKISRFDHLEGEGERELQKRQVRAKEITAKMLELFKGFKIIDQKSGLTFKGVPGGSFKMGSTHGDSFERPVHQVSVKTFLMSETEVTVGQYRKCVEAGVCDKPGRGSKCTWGRSEDHPINCLDWGQARTFAVWVGGDLPTEAQWEYAARGGQKYRYSGRDQVDEVGWYESNADATKAVKTKKANGYGLYDMSGNVWEWLLDEWHDSYRGAPSEAENPWGNIGVCSQKCDNKVTRRIVRGGGWVNDSSWLRVAKRNYQDSVWSGEVFGFRVRRTFP